MLLDKPWFVFLTLLNRKLRHKLFLNWSDKPPLLWYSYYNVASRTVWQNLNPKLREAEEPNVITFERQMAQFIRTDLGGAPSIVYDLNFKKSQTFCSGNVRVSRNTYATCFFVFRICDTPIFRECVSSKKALSRRLKFRILNINVFLVKKKAVDDKVRVKSTRFEKKKKKTCSFPRIHLINNLMVLLAYQKKYSTIMAAASLHGTARALRGAYS